MMTILLYGFLGKKFGKVHKYAVKTPAEAIAALSNTIPNFKKELIDGGYYKVIRGGKEDAWGLEGENMYLTQPNTTSLRLVPVPQGSGGGGFFSIVLGVALIWATGGLAGLGLTGMSAFAAGGALAGFASFGTALGMSLLLGGISQMLFSPPDVRQNDSNPAENKPSYSFNGPVNTVAQGGPIPLCYGKVLTGSQVVSAGLSAEPLAI